MNQIVTYFIYFKILYIFYPIQHFAYLDNPGMPLQDGGTFTLIFKSRNFLQNTQPHAHLHSYDNVVYNLYHRYCQVVLSKFDLSLMS